MSTNDILFHEKPSKSGLIGEVILNRPHALNALSLDMCRRFGDQLNHWKLNEDIKAVIVKGAGNRAFCAGGDVRALYENRHKNPKCLSQFFWHEYRLNTVIHHFPKPFFAFMHHITMGGGAGISIHGKYRIAVENLTFAMPETKIGFYPDIGANYFLNHCPGYTGLYLGLTGNVINAATAHQLGLVTHIIPQDKIDAFESGLYDTDNISDAFVDSFSINGGDSELETHMNTINDCFSAHTIDDIFIRLNNENDWARRIAKALKTNCPTSLKITFEAYHRAKKMEFDEIMQMDFNLSQQFLIEKDFFEGVRAVLIDKDQSPKWQSEISNDELKSYFEFKGQRLF